SLVCVWAWVAAPGTRRGRRGGTGWLLLFYLSLALRLLAKGPVVLIHVVIAIVAYHVCYRRRAPRAWVGHLLGAALMLAIALPWPLAVLRAVPNAVQLWRYESGGERCACAVRSRSASWPTTRATPPRGGRTCRSCRTWRCRGRRCGWPASST